MKNKSKFSLFKNVLFRNTLIGLFLWSFIIFAIAIRSIETLKESTLQLAKKEAETHLILDNSFRKWVSLHGGFYVPVDSLTRPSPYLNHLKYRDIVTSKGDTLTLINPARALRLFNEYAKKQYGVAGHITSLKLLRPENAPDPWERKALKTFEKGNKQVVEVISKNGQPVLRLIKPLYVKKSCLKCHGKQGYKVGDIRGGVSIMVPVGHDLRLMQKKVRGNIVAFLFIWLIGMVSIILSTKAINKKNISIEKVQKELEKSNRQLEKRVIERTSELEKINKQLNNEINEKIKTENILKISEERYKGVIMSTASCIAVYQSVENGNNFRLVEFNPMAEKAENISREQVIGKLVTEVFHGVVEFGLFKVFQDVYKTGKPQHFPIKLYKDNRIYGYRENYVYKLSSGEIVAVYQDVTRRVKTELVQKVVYNISNAVSTVATTADLIVKIQAEIAKLMDASNFFVALYDEKTDTLSMPYYFDEKDNFRMVSAKNTLSRIVIKTGKPLLVTDEDKKKLELEGRLVRQGSFSKVWLGVPLKNDKKVIGVVVVQNYENENAYSKQDVKMLEFIAGQIGMSIQRIKYRIELEAALKKAQESDRLKSAFLANMSHEIRTPMNGILGFASLLKEPDLSGEEVQKYTDVIQISGQRMLNIINNLIDISKIEAGQMQVLITECNINKQMEYLKALFYPEVMKKELLMYAYPGLPEKESNVLTDTEKFYAIFSNLIKNAVKYTHNGTVEFGYEKKGAVLEFYVKDTGIGIPKERQGAIFDRFVQADIEDRQVYEGAGLGLTISKAFVEMLGGKIWVESTEGQGTEFYFTIPYKPVSDKKKVPYIKHHANKSEDVKELKKASVLIVDDEPVSISYISAVIKDFCTNIYYADNGVTALEEFEKHPDINIILMDMKMPVMNGYEATKKIRETNKEVVIIAQTAYALKQDRKKTLAAGCNDYISKPVDKEELIELIKKYL